MLPLVPSLQPPLGLAAALALPGVRPGVGASEWRREVRAALEPVLSPVALPEAVGQAVGAQEAPPRPAGATDAQVRQWYLDVEELARRTAKPLKGLDAAQRELVFEAAYRHPVAGIDDPSRLQRYDPQGLIGFCFGRAMTTQLLARRMGLEPSSIRKLFIVGDLRSGRDPEWRFHVTTLVRGTDGRWHAVDPILQGPMPVQQWIRQVQATWDRGRRARLYLTGPDTVLPDLAEVPEPGKETGASLIELSFEPSGRTGFKPRRDLGPSVFELAPSAQAEFLAQADGRGKAFDFLGVTINGERFDYRGYFADLLWAILHAPGAAAREAAAPQALGDRTLRQPVAPGVGAGGPGLATRGARRGRFPGVSPGAGPQLLSPRLGLILRR